MLRRLRTSREEEGRAASLAPGRVTRLVAQKRNMHRLSVFVDGVFAFGVHQDVALRYGICAGAVLTVQAQEEILSAETQHAAHEVALRYLGYAPRTEQEVRARLLHAGFASPVPEEVVRTLRKKGYLSDADCALQYVQARFRSRGYGPSRLRAELRRRGIGERDISAALQALGAAEDFDAAAWKYAVRRWPLLRGSGPVRRKKLTDYLVRRGYSYDTINGILAKLQ